jgi:hypothetical protein
MAPKNPRSRRAGPGRPGAEPVHVTVEPKPGRSDAEIAQALQHAGALEIESLAPGFLSAIVPLSHLDQLRAIAEVHPKVRKQMH